MSLDEVLTDDRRDHREWTASRGARVWQLWKEEDPDAYAIAREAGANGVLWLVCSGGGTYKNRYSHYRLYSYTAEVLAENDQPSSSMDRAEAVRRGWLDARSDS